MGISASGKKRKKDPDARCHPETTIRASRKLNCKSEAVPDIEHTYIWQCFGLSEEATHTKIKGENVYGRDDEADAGEAEADEERKDQDGGDCRVLADPVGDR